MADDEPVPQLLEVEGDDVEVFGLATHPSRDLLALGLVDGRALLYTYEGMGETCKLSTELSAHAEACRAVCFHTEGERVFTGSSDKSLRAHDVETGKEAWACPSAHEEAVNCLHYCAAEGLLASGDDAGVVRLWDCRAPPSKATATIKKNEDFISDLLAHEGLLFAASGDNTLLTYDLGHRKVLTRSMDQEDELLSLCVAKHGRKVVAGTQSGVLLLFSWGQWNNCTDRFLGHPETVEALVKVDEETILTGSSDGLIRLCSLQPNKLLGVLGSHDDFPVERLAFSHDRRLLASIAHDSAVRLWDMTILEDDGEEGEDEDGDEEASEEESEAEAEAAGGTGGGASASSDEDEDEDYSSSGDGSSDSDDGSSGSGGGDSSEGEGEGKKGPMKGKQAVAAQQKKGAKAPGAAAKKAVGKGEGKTGGGAGKRGKGSDSDSSSSDDGGGGGGGGKGGKGRKGQGDEQPKQGKPGKQQGKKQKLGMTEAESFFSDL